MALDIFCGNYIKLTVLYIFIHDMFNHILFKCIASIKNLFRFVYFIQNIFSFFFKEQFNEEFYFILIWYISSNALVTFFSCLKDLKSNKILLLYKMCVKRGLS